MNPQEKQNKTLLYVDFVPSSSLPLRSSLYTQTQRSGSRLLRLLDITSGDEAEKNPGSSSRHLSAAVLGSSLLLRLLGNSTPRPRHLQAVLRSIYRFLQFHCSFRQFFSSLLSYLSVAIVYVQSYLTVALVISLLRSPSNSTRSRVYNDRRTLQFVGGLPTGGKEASLCSKQE